MSVAVPVTTSAVRAAEAAALLYEHHHGRILAFCLRRLRNREEAEDAAQQTFLKAFGAMRGGFRPTVERAWLYRIAENVCSDRRRANGRRVQHEATDGAAMLDVIPARDSQPIEGLDEALAELTPAQRRALLLREWQGLSYREIASELQLSQSAVETLLFRARRSLAKRLDAVPLIPWLKSAVLGSGAKAVAAAAVTIGVGAAAVTPFVQGASPERAPARVRSAPPVTTEQTRVPAIDRDRVVPRAVERRMQPSAAVVDGRPEAAPAVVSPASTPAPSPPTSPSAPSSAQAAPVVQAAVPEPKLPAATLPEAPIQLPALPEEEVELPQPTLEPLTLEPLQATVDALPELPATLP